jgi:hypothetical protein
MHTAAMKPRRDRRISARAAVRIAVPLMLVGYAYWATGLAPFTVASYAAVAGPVLVAALWTGVAEPARRGPSDAGATSPAFRVGPALPILIIAAIAIGLETIALALGGRSASVPTLSTIVDHALTWHASRFALFVAWLVAASVPLSRLSLRNKASRP